MISPPVRTMRRDRLLLKLTVISLFFTACYLSKYPAPRVAVVLWSNLAVRNGELEYDGLDEQNAVNAHVVATWRKCRRRRVNLPTNEALLNDGSKNQKLRIQIREVIGSIQQEALELTRRRALQATNLVAISGVQGTLAWAGDPLIDHYERVLRESGYAVETVESSGNRRKRVVSDVISNQTENYAGVFCLQGPCRNLPTTASPIRVNRIAGFEQTLDELNGKTICQQGEEARAFLCYRTVGNATAPPNAETSSTSWVVTQQGVPTFAVVQNDSLPRFLDELQRAANLSAKTFLVPAFTVIQRPVRVSVTVLAVGDAPTVFYLHQEATIRIGGFVNYGTHQERETGLTWSISQFQKYLRDMVSPAAASVFLQKVQTAVANVFQDAPTSSTSNKSCQDCYQILDVTLFVSASLESHVVTIADHGQLPRELQFPSKILVNALTLLLDQTPIDAVATEILESYLTTIVGSYNISLLDTSNMQTLADAAVFKTKAANYGFDYIAVADTRHRQFMLSLRDFVMPCVGEEHDNSNEVAIEDTKLSTLSDLDNRCQYDSAFRSLLVGVDIYPAFEFHPRFHPMVTSYEISIPFHVTFVEMEFTPADCATEVAVAGESVPLTSRRDNFTVGVGENVLTINVVKRTPTGPASLRNYTFKLNRFDRVQTTRSLQTPDRGTTEKCSWRQTCELKLYPMEPCGLQKEADISNKESCLSVAHRQDRWILPCRSCQEEASCDWGQAVWSPDLCADTVPDTTVLNQCLQDKKLVFIGDSTNRGIMAYIMQQHNGSLWQDEKIHSVKSYAGPANGNTSYTFAYYPQFWLPQSQRPSFMKTFHQAVKAAQPLANNSDTVFVVGGLQFMRVSHLRELRKSLTRSRLEGAIVVIKTLGSGFFVPAHGVHHIDSGALAKLQQINQQIILESHELGFHVVDTLAMTSSRFNEFRAGKCSCHFHSVTPNLPLLSEPHKTYTVTGTINALYSQSVLREICS